MHQRLALLSSLLLSLAACAELEPLSPPVSEAEVILRADKGPDGAQPGTCWGKSIVPAVIETVTVQEQVTAAQFAPDGTVLVPATYATRMQQQIVQERQEQFFETLCPEDFTPEFVASLQRALQARALYRGPASGQMDQRTRAAVRQYQNARGLDSGILSIATGQELGLIRSRFR